MRFRNLKVALSKRVTQLKSPFLLRSLLLLVIAVTFVGIILLLLPLIRGAQIGYEEFGPPPGPDDDELTIVYRFDAPDLRNASHLDSYIRQVWAPAKFQYAGQQVCFDRIIMKSKRRSYHSPYESNYFGNPRGRYGGGGSSLRGAFNSEGFGQSGCISRNTGLGKPLSYSEKEHVHRVNVISDYYFPFDGVILDMKVWVSGTLKLDSGTSVPLRTSPRVLGFVTAPNWDVDAKVYQDPNRAEPSTTVQIYFRRPIVYRVLTPLLLLLLAVIIILLPLIRSFGDFVQVSVALAFGIWGTREILLPSDVEWATIIEPLILTLYALLALSAFARLVIVPAWNKVEESTSE